jgi:hypothetical protein
VNGWALFWLVVFGASAVLFFAIAVVVTIRGVGDLRDLLGKTARNPRTPPADRG